MLLACVVGLIASAAAAEKPVSFQGDVSPVLRRSCVGCHRPGKLKGKLDLSSVEMIMKGGKSGPAVVAGQPRKSLLIQQVSGPKPLMPEEGDPLTSPEVALISKWVRQGAREDKTKSRASSRPAGPIVYRSSPAIPAIAFSPDGKMLAVAGTHEVILRDGDGSNVIARLVGDAPRIESLAFSPDGTVLAAAGGAASEFGEVQVWDMTTLRSAGAFKAGRDTLYGVAFSPDGRWLALGGAEKAVRVLSRDDGKERFRFDQHSDWVFGVAFNTNGSRLATASRDRLMKWIDSAQGAFIDDLNKPYEGLLCLARHPTEDLLAHGTDTGAVRVYRMNENTALKDPDKDPRYVREFDRLPGPVHAVAFSADGNLIAVGGAGPEARVYRSKDGGRVATLKGHAGPIYTVAFRPQGGQVVTAGQDGQLRFYDLPSGLLRATISGVPVWGAQSARP